MGALTQHYAEASDGVRIAYGTVGAGDGPPVVLCHGICASGRQFEADAAYFATLGYRVIVPDLRAHGRSGVPAKVDANYTIERLAGDMLAVLDDAGAERVHWVGNSLGGIVGLATLGQSPERFASFATFGTAYRLALPAAAAPVLPMLFRVLGPKRLGAMAGVFTTKNPAGRGMIAEAIEDFDAEAGWRIARHVRAYDLAAAAQAFAGPVLVIKGGEDKAVNLALGRTFAAMKTHPDFERVDLKRAGHCANFDRPDEVRSTLDTFWRRAGAQPRRAA